MYFQDIGGGYAVSQSFRLTADDGWRRLHFTFVANIAIETGKQSQYLSFYVVGTSRTCEEFADPSSQTSEAYSRYEGRVTLAAPKVELGAVLTKYSCSGTCQVLDCGSLVNY